MHKAAFVYSKDCLTYDFGKSHVFRPERAYSVYEVLNRENLFSENLTFVKPARATKDELLLFHTKAYVDALEKEDEVLLSDHGIGFGDNPFFKGIYEAVTTVGGATLTALNSLLEGFQVAFSFSGGLHHAHPDFAYGFCLVNDAVIAIKKLFTQGYSKPGGIMYVDIDAHFGDGVVYGLYDRPEVITLSVHESGRYLFPGTGFSNETGEGKGKGLKINVPLPPYSAEQEFLTFLNEIYIPLVRSVKPEFLIVQAGTDGYREDPLTHLKYSPYCYFAFFQATKELLDEIGFKLLVLGGGGYVPWFASLIWLSVTLFLAHGISFEESLALALKNKDILPGIRKVDFKEEDSKLADFYLEDFENTVNTCKTLVNKVADRLKEIGLDS